jgi:hypothetical protein
VVAVEWLVQWLARPVGIHGNRTVDRLHSGKSDLQGKVFPDIAPGPRGQEHGVGLTGHRICSAHCEPRRRRCSSSARTCAAV